MIAFGPSDYLHPLPTRKSYKTERHVCFALQESEIGNDLRFSLGFLGNYKRTNVALSRAKSMLIVVGNMSLLSRDATWHDAIKLVKEMNALRGDLASFQMGTPTHGAASQWGGRSDLPQAPEAADGVVDRPWREHM